MILGLAAAVACIVAGARARPTPSPSVRAHAPVVADDRGALREVVMHYVPELEGTFGDTYRDFLGSLSQDTRVDFVVRRGTRARLDAFLGRPARHVVEVDVSFGIWSKDRALVLSRPDDSRISLLVPPKPRGGEGSRPGDWEVVPAFARSMPDRFEVKKLPIAFDAGDFTVAGDRVLVDPNLFARNAARGLKTPAELTKLLGREVARIGESVGDVPRHHMSMYMAALEGNVALVGDPAEGVRILGEGFAPGETSLETAEPLRADASPIVIARFDRAAKELEKAGFRVVRIPTLAFDDKTYFAYTNGVFETRGGERIARIPVFDVPALDDAARGVYEALGWRVVPIRARKVYVQHGTIGCMVNILARS
ncbi:MAG: hypothetical protein JST00_37325 [Deltaproteobacteria bacterium]|nr:hypothetical protein [Deltaproteobacteria bacterium]